MEASEWQSSTDLVNYLGGQAIGNTGIGVPWPPATTSGGALQQAWTPATPAAFSSFRVDFNDPNRASPWRGAVTVSVNGPGGTRTAYAVRSGADGVNPWYSSVLVPLPAAANGNDTVTSATVTVTRETGSPFSVTINLGKSAAIGSVKLITHADQMAAINWPNDVSASVGTNCAPQSEGIPRRGFRRQLVLPQRNQYSVGTARLTA